MGLLIFGSHSYFLFFFSESPHVYWLPQKSYGPAGHHPALVVSRASPTPRGKAGWSRALLGVALLFPFLAPPSPTLLPSIHPSIHHQLSPPLPGLGWGRENLMGLQPKALSSLSCCLGKRKHLWGNILTFDVLLITLQTFCKFCCVWG